MPPFIIAGLILGGFGLLSLFDKDNTKLPKAPPTPTPPAPPTNAEKSVNRDELRRVMSYLGKRSGKVRGGKF